MEATLKTGWLFYAGKAKAMPGKLHFSTRLEKFGQMGEKTGWTYVPITAEMANTIKKGCRKSFRVKGRIDQTEISGVALMPMGDGEFILTINASLRRQLKKTKGDLVELFLQEDKSEKPLSAELIECLADEPDAFGYFQSIPASHRRYFSNWVESAKTNQTKSRRIAAALDAFIRKMTFGEMIRLYRKNAES